ncbi:DegT/DnrJ/EryC1/StrS family aminotransferase, partial [Micrococcus sp. SIMBA_131]
PLDLLGQTADHATIGRIAADHGAVMLSDAAASLGATRDGKQSAAYGAAAAGAFHGNKIMTTSGGRALLTDDAEMAA